MFSKKDLIRFYEEVDIQEPFEIYVFGINDKYSRLEISDNELKIKFLPFIFANFEGLQSVCCTDNYKNTGEYRSFLTCFLDVQTHKHLKEGREQECYDENWNIIIEFFKKTKNSDTAQFYIWVLKNKNEITSFNVDFVRNNKEL